MNIRLFHIDWELLYGFLRPLKNYMVHMVQRLVFLLVHSCLIWLSNSSDWIIVLLSASVSSWSQLTGRGVSMVCVSLIYWVSNCCVHLHSIRCFHPSGLLLDQSVLLLSQHVVITYKIFSIAFFGYFYLIIEYWMMHFVIFNQNAKLPES
jgi:hypothetical protein